MSINTIALTSLCNIETNKIIKPNSVYKTPAISQNTYTLIDKDIQCKYKHVTIYFYKFTKAPEDTYIIAFTLYVSDFDPINYLGIYKVNENVIDFKDGNISISNCNKITLTYYPENTQIIYTTMNKWN